MHCADEVIPGGRAVLFQVLATEELYGLFASLRRLLVTFEG
jgi:hypothetical protein